MHYKQKKLLINKLDKNNTILDSSLVPKSNQVIINILTRTSNRPFYFAECRNSIVNQSYKNIRHIVSVDDETSYKYVKENGLLDRDIIQIERPHRISLNHMPYNLYMNYLLQEVHQGWIMFLDDDDILFDTNSILTLVNNSDVNVSKFISDKSKVKLLILLFKLLIVCSNDKFNDI